MTAASSEHRALIVTDVQNDFCEGGSLEVANGGAVARGISALLDRCAGDPYEAAYSGFEGTDGEDTLAEILRRRGVRHLDLVGIATDYCVLATARDGVREGFDVTVLTDLTAGVAPDTTAKALQDLRDAGVQLRASA